MGYVWRCKCEILASPRNIKRTHFTNLKIVCSFAISGKCHRHFSTHAEVHWYGIARILCFSSEDMEFCVLHFQTSSSVGKF